ncbi:MAG: helicase, partial [Paenibacillus sp.]|nr:helicase [Paenibacillus sp.]
MSNWELELQNEQERVDTVIEKVEAEQQKLGEQVGSVRTEIVSIRKDFWDDVTVNLDNEDEAIETATSMRQQAEVLSERERTHRQAYNQHKLLMKLKENPYFGRIDFVEQGDQAAE